MRFTDRGNLSAVDGDEAQMMGARVRCHKGSPWLGLNAGERRGVGRFWVIKMITQNCLCLARAAAGLEPCEPSSANTGRNSCSGQPRQGRLVRGCGIGALGSGRSEIQAAACRRSLLAI
jgi:hypothetical protein